jgi:hypothetical protein
MALMLASGSVTQCHNHKDHRRNNKHNNDAAAVEDKVGTYIDTHIHTQTDTYTPTHDAIFKKRK